MSMDDTSVVDRLEGLLASEEAEEEGLAESEELRASGDDDSQPEDDAYEAEAEADDEDEAKAETDSDDDDEAEEEEQDGAGTITVEIDGQTRTLTSDEVKSGIMLEADYRRKTAEVSTERKALAEAQKAFETERQRAIADFNERLKVLQELQDPEPEWDADDPIGSIERAKAWERKNKSVQEKLQAHYQGLQEQHAKAEHARQQHLYQQHQLLPELIPEWRDQSVAQKEMAEISAFLRNNGFSQEEIGAVSDARLVKVLRQAFKAQQFDKAKQTVVKKKTAGKPKVVKPGTTPKKDQGKVAARRSLAQARQTGRSADMVQALLDGGYA